MLRTSRRPGFLDSLAPVLLLALAVLPAQADRVTVKGTVLKGTVLSIEADDLVFETVYGKGAITIPVADVEAIETDVPFHVFYQRNEEGADGRVVGLSAQEIRIQPEGGAPKAIQLEEVFATYRDPGEDADILERADLALPYWHGNFDLAFNSSQATDDTLGVTVGIGARRERGPNRLRIDTRYRLGKQTKDGMSQVTNENELYGVIRQEYDIAARWFVFGSVDGEYDEVERLSLRTVPRLGAGYVVYQSEAARFAVDAGPAYVYQRYFGGSTEDYPAATFGAESSWDLPFGGISWRSRLDYTPSLEDWTQDYILRGETWLEMPIVEFLSFKAGIVNLYNNSPAAGTNRNSLTTNVGLSAGF